MNRVTRGTVLLAAVLVAMSCEGDPTGDLRNGADHIVATPSAIFLTSGDSTNVVIEVVDKQGNRLQGKFDLLGFDQGITVVSDTTFNNVYNNKGELVPPSKWTRARYKVTANAQTGDLTWRVSGGGLDTSLSVRIVPDTSGVPVPTLSVLNVASVSDTVEAVVPAPFIWRSGASVFFRYKIDSVKTNGDTAYAETKAHIAGISSARDTIYFVAPPGIFDPGIPTSGRPAHFVGLGLDYAGPTGYTDSTNSGTQLVMTPAINTTGLTINLTSVQAADTVVVTAPAGMVFSPPSTVFGAPPASVASVAGTGVYTIGPSVDSTQLSIIVGPNGNGNVQVTNLSIRGAPTLGAFKLTSGTTVLTSGAAPTTTIDKTVAAAGDTITVTAPAGWRFHPGKSVPSVGSAGLLSLGVASDSLSLRFVIGPSANSTVSVTNVTMPGAPTGPVFTLVSAATLTSAAVPSFPGTLSNASPAPGATVTITAGSGFKFLPTATLTHASGTGIPVVIISRAADSSAITFIPAPNAPVGLLYADGIVLDFLTGVPINDLPNTVSITAPAPLYSGTGAFGSAPVIAMPTAGNSIDVVDITPFFSTADCDANNPGGAGTGCKIFGFTVGTAVTLTFSNTWSNLTDLGLYFTDDTQSDLGLSCDSHGDGTSGQPEVCSMAFTPGTYYMLMTTYSPYYSPPNDVDPYWFRINVTAQ
jgi:hypothetical protein